MKKTLLFYTFMILAIAVLAILGNIKIYNFSFIEFPQTIHFLLELTISILLFIIFLTSNNLYLKTKDERFLILGYGFLLGLIFNLIHIFTSNVFPYDNLSFGNLEKKPTLIYLLIANLTLSISVYISIIHKTVHNSIKNDIKPKFINFYLYALLILTILPLIIYYSLPQFLNHIYIAVHAMEYINYALYLIIAVIIINSRINYNKPPLNMFIAGLFVLGLGCMFYINPLLLQVNSILGHVFQILGLFLILLGVPELTEISNSLRVRDILSAYLSLLLILFYIVFVPIISGVFNIIFPKISGYLFIEFLLIFQLIIYIFSIISWNKVANVYLASEKNKTLINIFESMRRISNPNIIKNTIVNEIKEHFHPDKVFIIVYSPENNSFYYDRYAEYLPSRTLLDSNDIDSEALEFEKFQDTFNNININFKNIEEYLVTHSLNEAQQENLLNISKIKSLYTIPINYKETLLGYLVLQYKYDYKNLSEEELSFLNKLAIQIGIAMNK